MSFTLHSNEIKLQQEINGIHLTTNSGANQLLANVTITAYLRKLKQRLKAEGNETVTNCHSLKMCR